LSWTDDVSPRSERFGDVYFSAQDGLAESRAVFLQGCGLPEAWARRSHFTVAELGFGTGLNIAALLELWSRTHPPGARLQIFSVEGYPMAAAEAARALSAWPELTPAAAALLAGWPAPTPGFHRIDLPEFDAVLDIAVLDAAEALDQWDGKADAWFLDGFAPSANPAMWSDAVLARVAARSAPGARAATFTVAGHVRRGLQAAGFAVERRPGFGRKRERLEAALPGSASPRPSPTVCIVGAGIAGAALARALAAAGSRPLLVEAEAAGAGASGNPAALVTPRFDAGGGVGAALFAQAFERAVTLYDAIGSAVIATGALQLEAGERDASRFDRIAAQPFWDEGALQRLDPDAVSLRLGETALRGGLFIREGRVIEPASVMAAWLADTPLIRARVGSLDRAGGGWRLMDADGCPIVEADAVVLCAGWGLAALRPELRLAPARGQATIASGPKVAAAAWGGYVVPTRDGVLFGATFDRGETATDTRPQDDLRNLATLAEAHPGLAEALDGKPLSSRARIRATTPDHLPLAGPLAPGLWVLGGLGARGFTTAPLLGEHLAARILDLPSPLPDPLSRAVEPLRRSATFADAGPDLS
jgi:tRNA 5-methylaminomethyl-2-thiouridine biosynthesis bifunctional protein